MAAPTIDIGSGPFYFGRSKCLKTSNEVSPEKLRGGFYSPSELVRVCWDRVESLLTGEGPLRILEPSAGDGAFVRGLSGHPLGARVSFATAVEILDTEAALCAAAIDQAPFAGEVANESAVAWALRDTQPYDVAVGNPPFVRFQFISETERKNINALEGQLGVSFRGVSNLWLPVLLAGLDSLKSGGVFAFIVPEECFTGISGQVVRDWLLRHVHRLQVDLFAPGSFPGVLQNVVVISGRMTHDDVVGTCELHFREHNDENGREWHHNGVRESRTWTRFLLTTHQVAALEEAAHLKSVNALSAVARFEVATVTGANGFFCVEESDLERFELTPWARPLLPRTRHAQGLKYTCADHEATAASGAKTYMLDFSDHRSDPRDSAAAWAYLESGVEDGLPLRYKCRIREPWYRVPVVAPGAMLMAKRSHRFPRVVVNEAEVLTTDTIYRGRLLGDSDVTVTSLTASFHNSLTLLTTEIEGRSFGGGVLELVPSEVSRLLIPLPVDMGEEFDRLDWVARMSGDEGENLIEETDVLVTKKTDGITSQLMDVLRQARRDLVERRLARN